MRQNEKRVVDVKRHTTDIVKSSQRKNALLGRPIVKPLDSTFKVNQTNNPAALTGPISNTKTPIRKVTGTIIETTSYRRLPSQAVPGKMNGILTATNGNNNTPVIGSKSTRCTGTDNNDGSRITSARNVTVRKPRPTKSEPMTCSVVRPKVNSSNNGTSRSSSSVSQNSL